MPKLTKESEAPKPLHPNHIPTGRTIIGEVKIHPTKGGRCMILYEKDLKPAMFYTSTIQQIISENDTEVVFRTLNSIYKLEL